MSASSMKAVVSLEVSIGMPAAQVGPIGAHGVACPPGGLLPPDAAPYQNRLSGPKSIAWSRVSRYARASSRPQPNCPR